MAAVVFDDIETFSPDDLDMPAVQVDEFGELDMDTGIRDGGVDDDEAWDLDFSDIDFGLDADEEDDSMAVGTDVSIADLTQVNGNGHGPSNGAAPDWTMDALADMDDKRMERLAAKEPEAPAVEVAGILDGTSLEEMSGDPSAFVILDDTHDGVGWVAPEGYRPPVESIGEFYGGLQQTLASMPFVMGDIANWIERTYGEDALVGMVTFMDSRIEQLSKWQWMCSRIPQAIRRNPNKQCSATHHIYVSGVHGRTQDGPFDTDQEAADAKEADRLYHIDRFLELAELNSWTSDQLRRAVAAFKNDAPLPDDIPLNDTDEEKETAVPTGEALVPNANTLLNTGRAILGDVDLDVCAPLSGSLVLAPIGVQPAEGMLLPWDAGMSVYGLVPSQFANSAVARLLDYETKASMVLCLPVEAETDWFAALLKAQTVMGSVEIAFVHEKQVMQTESGRKKKVAAGWMVAYRGDPRTQKQAFRDVCAGNSLLVPLA